ncbi:MAG: TM1266 family iron-only hydrogenase system putative regulator [Sphaerochaeta sp.]
MEDSRLAIIAIIIENKNAVEKINELLHSCAPFIIGRMGMPYPKKNVSIITVIVDAPQDIISTLSGKLGQVKDVSIKTTYSKV